MDQDIDGGRLHRAPGERSQAQLSRLQWSRTVDAAGWIAGRLHPFDRHDVGSIIPNGFAAYARILHPAYRSEGDGTRPVRWAEIAARTGRIVHPQVQFHRLSLPPEGHDTPSAGFDQPPPEGSLPGDEVAALVAVLAEHTDAARRCWFCLWDGYGWVQGGSAVAELVSTRGEGARVSSPLETVPAEVLAGPRVRLPHRDYLLYSGPLTAATALARYPWHQTPNLWWPDDRAWCVASEIDLPWTYAGGSAHLVEAILTDGRLEAVPARLTDRVTQDSDTINT